MSSVGRGSSPPRRGKGADSGKGRRGIPAEKNLNTLYRESEEVEVKKRALRGRGGGLRAGGSERETEDRAHRRGASKRRRREPHQRELAGESQQREEQEAERQREEEKEDDYLPPADGSKGEEEGEGEVGEEGETSMVYLRGPVQLPKPVALALRPVVRPDGSGFEKIEDVGRNPTHVFGSLLKRHYPGLVRRPDSEVDAPATRWKDYKLKPDGTHGTKYEAVLQDFWDYFRCEEGQMNKCRLILEKKGVKAVTDMMYEARISAVIRIEADKKNTCIRKVALGKFPTADEYISVKPTWCALHSECWRQLALMWDSNAWKAKNKSGHDKRMAIVATHHQGSTTVGGFAKNYARHNKVPVPNTYVAFHMAKLASAAKAKPYDPQTPESSYNKSTFKRKTLYDAVFKGTEGEDADPSSRDIIPELVLVTGQGKKHSRPALGASSFPGVSESPSSIRARSMSSSLQIQRRDECVRELREELEATRQERHQMREKMEEMEARNRRMEENFNASMEAQRQMVATMLRANGITVPDMPGLGAMMIYSPNTNHGSADGSNGTPMSQAHGPVDPSPPPP